MSVQVLEVRVAKGDQIVAFCRENDIFVEMRIFKEDAHLVFRSKEDIDKVLGEFFQIN